MTELEVRMEAARWLATSLSIMNNDGAHWMQGDYHESFVVEDPDSPEEHSVWNQTIRDYIKVKARIEWRHCSVGGLQHTRERMAEAAIGGLEYDQVNWAAHHRNFDQVYNAAEVALAIAIMAIENDWTDASAYDSETVVIRYNDSEGRTWEEIKQAHSRAITALIDGTVPLTWPDYGAMLAKDVTFNV